MARIGRPPILPIIRFFQQTTVTTDGSCWIWNGYVAKDGYGVMKLYEPRRPYQAHRFIWEFIHGKLPHRFKCVCHKCDNRRCVNPLHLFIGTPGENTRDAASKGRMPKGSRNGNSRLKESDIPVIRELLKEGKSQQFIADKFHVHQTIISDIALSKTWKHV